MNNPFEFEQARKLTNQQILDLYIPGYNYSETILSTRNVFFVGERGTGKSMALLYHSFALERLKAAKEQRLPKYDVIGIHVDCNSMLIHKPEHDLLEAYMAQSISEHFLVIQIMNSIVSALLEDENIVVDAADYPLREDLEHSLDITLPNRPFLSAVKLELQRQNTLANKAMNAAGDSTFYDDAGTFMTWAVPLLNCLRQIPRLSATHFSIMMDDAQLLNYHQNQLLNSWISYRDNSLFSFKVATTRIDRPSLNTSTGSTILENHDFLTVDMEPPYHNKFTEYGDMAREIIMRRLNVINSEKTPAEFFPVNAQFEQDMEAFKLQTEKEAKQKYGDNNKKISDYVYKYARARYFKELSSKANIPPYSGFDTLVHISTGVIRNLLQPCFRMYDKARADLRDTPGAPVLEIPSSIQTQVIKDMSLEKWNYIKTDITKNVQGCSGEKAEQIFNLFENLSILFQKRLRSDISEPRAITFTISEVGSPEYQKVFELLNIARKAQILYTYFSSAKDDGGKETYFVPNRILWPSKKLDPCGQHARVSIRASNLWEAAKNNTPIPVNGSEAQGQNQQEIFGEST